MGICALSTVGAFEVSVDCEPYGVGSTITSSLPRESENVPALGWRWSVSIVAWHSVTNQIALSSQRVRA